MPREPAPEARNYYEEAVRYALEVIEGDRPACKWIRLRCQGFIDDLVAAQDKSFPFYLDVDAAHHAAEFIELLPLTKVKGRFEKGRRPTLVLDPWQCFAIVNIFGWKHRDSGWRRYREALLFVPRKNGKALALDTPLPTPDGWTTMGAVQVGDALIDETGANCRVTATTEIMRDRPCFRVSFADGTSIVADADHQWLARPAWGKPRVVTTQEMTRRLTVSKGFYWSIDVSAGVEGTDAFLPVDPWVFGFWIGDGSARDARVTIGDTDLPEIREQFRRRGLLLRPVPSSPLAYWVHNGKPKRSWDAFSAQLRSVGVFGDKRIPRRFLRASRRQRLELLRGLIDSDGHITPKGQVEIVTTSDGLRDDYLELLRSLGYKVKAATDRARLNGRDCGPRHRIQFYAYDDTPVATLDRKRRRQKPAPSEPTRARRLSITAIEPVPSVPVRCIEVDSPSHLFQAGRGWTPTHNSEFAAAIALYMMLADGEDAAEVYCGGRSEDQARFIFNAAKNMIKYRKEIREHFGIEVLTERIAVPDTNSFIEKLIGDPPDGSDPQLYCCDEFHEHRTAAQFDTMQTGMISRKQSLILVTTTAGINIEGPCYSYVKDAEKALMGALDRPDLFSMIFTVDPDVDLTSEIALRQANPGYDTLIDGRELRVRQHNAKSIARNWSKFLIKHLNVWQGSEDAYFDTLAWTQKCGQREDDFRAARDYARALYEAMRGRRCFIGGDLSGKLDMTALALVFPEANGGFTVIPRFYLPEETLSHRYDQDSDVWKWTEAGWIEKTEGNMIDIFRVAADVEQFLKDFDVAEIPYDPAHSVAFVQALQGKDGGKLIEWPNRAQYTSDPMKECAGLIMGGKVRHDGNPVMTWQISNVIRRKSTRGDLDYPDKARDENKIDGPVAMIQAWGRTMLAPQPISLEVHRIN